MVELSYSIRNLNAARDRLLSQVEQEVMTRAGLAAGRLPRAAQLPTWNGVKQSTLNILMSNDGGATWITSFVPNLTQLKP
jgi:hypothetical protein